MYPQQPTYPTMPGQQFPGMQPNYMVDPVPNQVYQMQNKLQPMKQVDIAGASRDQGAQALIWDTNGNGNQRFQFNMVQPGVYQIIAQHSNMYLAPQGYQQGAHVVQSHQPANWEVSKSFDGAYQMKVQGTNMFMDLSGGNIQNGGEVIIWPGNGGDNQKWTLRM